MLDRLPVPDTDLQILQSLQFHFQDPLATYWGGILEKAEPLQILPYLVATYWGGIPEKAERANTGLPQGTYCHMQGI